MAADCSQLESGNNAEMSTIFTSRPDWGTACITNRGSIELRGKNAAESFRAIPNDSPSGSSIDSFNLIDREGNYIGTAQGQESPFGGKDYQLEVYRPLEMVPETFHFNTE